MMKTATKRRASAAKGEFVEKFKVQGTFVDRREAYIHKYVSRMTKFVLEREPDNSHDTNAIKVGISVRGGQYVLMIGYIPRGIAARIAPEMDAGAKFYATFRIKIINEKTGKFIALYLNLIKSI